MSPSTTTKMQPSTTVNIDIWWWISMIPLIFIGVLTFMDGESSLPQVNSTVTNISTWTPHAYNSSSFLSTDTIKRPPLTLPPWSLFPVTPSQSTSCALLEKHKPCQSEGFTRNYEEIYKSTVMEYFLAWLWDLRIPVVLQHTPLGFHSTIGIKATLIMCIHSCYPHMVVLYKYVNFLLTSNYAQNVCWLLLLDMRTCVSLHLSSIDL